MNAQIRPGYKLTEVGVIPEAWDISSLKDVCIKITDGTHDTPKPTKAGIPYLTAIHVKDNKIHHEDCLYLTKEDHEIIFKRCNPALNDVLMVNIGAGVATTALVDVDYEFSLKNVALLKPDLKYLIGSYLNYILAYKKTEITEALLSGGAQPFLSLTQICEIKIPIPSKEEQRAISLALSKMDTLISNLDQLIAKKRDIKQAAMQQLLTGQQRLPGFSGEWEVKRIDEVFFISTGKSKSAYITTYGNYWIVDMGSVSTDGKLIVSKATDFKGDFLNTGDLVMPKDDIGGGGIIGRVGYIEADKTYVLSDHVYRLTAKCGDPLFFSYAINGHQINSALRKKVIGSAQLGLSRKSVEEQEIPFPPLEEQTTIATFLSDMDSEIVALETRREKARQIKQGTMQVLLTGRVRVLMGEK